MPIVAFEQFTRPVSGVRHAVVDRHRRMPMMSTGLNDESSSSSTTGPERQQVPALLQHLALALAGHVRRLHSQGFTVPRGLEELTVLMAHLATLRQEPPPLAAGPERVQSSRVRDRLLVTKTEAADRLSVSVRTVERLVATGRLPQVHVERSARFRVKDLESYVEGLVDVAHGEPPSELTRHRPPSR